MDIFENQFPKYLSPVQSMEGSSVQVHAEYTNRNNNATDDTAMSGLDYPMGDITNISKRSIKPKPQQSINTGEIQQQADLARMLQPTIRALQSATDKAINKAAKDANGTSIEPKVSSGPRTSHMLRLEEYQSTLKSLLRKQPKETKESQADPSVPNTKSKKKKKKNGGVNTQANNTSGGSVQKPKKRKSKEGSGEQHMAFLIARRKNEDARKFANAERAARADTDMKLDVSDKGSDPRHWQTLYEQEYHTRTAKLRERQIRDENALMLAFGGLSFGGSKDAGDDYDPLIRLFVRLTYKVK
ncbi:hypothetical protein SBOR_5002 [Sclerotinia borealis F-4128]|uniref:Uncharacterized protein n=1 Tax=Sclerotinia borealis (strain F-4128) TaxID=1432307 RepID=W9CFE9_SCLBF|nr:hypothetical protein SBOR_5002 [Sclerotinia borealis F-4128]